MLVMVVASNMITPELDGISELGRWVFYYSMQKRRKRKWKGLVLHTLAFVCLETVILSGFDPMGFITINFTRCWQLTYF